MEKREARSRDGDAPAARQGCDTASRLSPSALPCSQDGERAALEGSVSGQETVRRRQDERPSFHIPRKNKERKALFQPVLSGSRESEELLKVLTSSYKDPTSAASYTYSNIRLVHSELLEKDFTEKKRELKQEGRLDKELTESYCFLLADPSKMQGICERGLSVGHSRITTLGNPTMGVYLSKYSDLLQMNPFDPGVTGEIVIFKVVKGRVKSIYENVSKNLVDPTPKFDCHVSKNASKVTSLWSYRAFELTQQYLYEYSFAEIKTRPRHVCPYAVVSFLYKHREISPPPKPVAPLRSNSTISDGSRVRSTYTLWSGQLLNGGKVLYHVCIRSSTRTFLPIKLPEKVDIGTAINFDHVKRKISPALFSCDTYSGMREVVRNGLYCSLFEVLDRSKNGNNLSVLLYKLEREKMVFVNPLADKGFLFLFSSAQMISSGEQRTDCTRSLQALFLFHDPRGVTKLSLKQASASELLYPEHPGPALHLGTFIPALHYSLMKVRVNPPKDLSAAVHRQAREYLSGCGEGKTRPYFMHEYKQNLDEREKLRPAPRLRHNLEGQLRSYLYSPTAYQLPVPQICELLESMACCPPEYSPVSDWEGSDGQPLNAKPNGAHGLQASHPDNDPEKMKELLKLIQMCKRSYEGDIRQAGEVRDGIEESGEIRGVRRKLEQENEERSAKRLRGTPQDNGEHSRDAKRHQQLSLSAAVSNAALRGSELRKDESQGAAKLIKFLAAFSKATRGVSPSRLGLQPTGRSTSSSDGFELPEAAVYDKVLEAHGHEDPHSRCAEEGQDEQAKNDYLEEQTAGSLSSVEVFSPGSSSEQHRGIELLGIKSERHGYREDEPSFSQGGYTTPLSEPKDSVYMDTRPEEQDGCRPVVEVPASPRPPDRQALFKRLDSILDRALSDFSSGVRDLLKENRVCYDSQLSLWEQREQLWMPAVTFSGYVSQHVSPVPVQSYVSALCEKMSWVMGTEPAEMGATPGSPSPTPNLVSLPHAVSLCTPPHDLLTTATSVLPQTPKDVPPQPRNGEGDEGVRTHKPEITSAPTNVEKSKTQTAPPLNTDPAQCSGSATFTSLISQLKPEVFSSLVEIIKDVQKNAVKFYIHSEEESEVCLEIKEYLLKLGNMECNPQSFLDSKNNLDKLLIIIQNEDIATHVHKIPALVSLKKLPSVSFAGVDSLDDVKNHTYNELFISGGIIVSDEFVLNPDFITHERLQAFLNFLEEQSSPESLWQWKVHCKTQKKLKELGRLNSDALALLNRLSTYEKRHLVEFLPYHECDAPSRQAPDLDCLVRLQAHHTKHRHIIFLTERRFEMFPHYSNNGIVIASTDDIMNSFHSLIGFQDSREEPPGSQEVSAPPTANEELTKGTSEVEEQLPSQQNKKTEHDECVEEEDMSLDSEEDSADIESLQVPLHEGSEDFQTRQPPPPRSLHYQLLSEPVQHAPPSMSPESMEFEALKTAISKFKSTHPSSSPMDFEAGGASPSIFNVNPHQSFLCPATMNLSYANCSSSQNYLASPCGPSLDSSLSAHLSTEMVVPDLSMSVDPPTAIQDRDESQDRGNKAIPATPIIPVPPPSAGSSNGSSRDDWVPPGWSQTSVVSSACGTPTSQPDVPSGATAVEGNSASGTPSSQGGATPGAKRANPGSSTPSSQGSLTPSQRPEVAAAPPREGGAYVAGLLPTPARVGTVNGRGHSAYDGSRDRGGGFPPPPLPPHGPRLGRGGPNWGPQIGRGGGRGSSSDFAQDYPWRKDFYTAQGDGYHTHRGDFNGW